MKQSWTEQKAARAAKRAADPDLRRARIAHDRQTEVDVAEQRMIDERIARIDALARALSGEPRE